MTFWAPSLHFYGDEGPDGQVPVEDYELPIGQAEVVQEGTDVALLHLMLRLLQAAFAVCVVMFSIAGIGRPLLSASDSFALSGDSCRMGVADWPAAGDPVRKCL